MLKLIIIFMTSNVYLIIYVGENHSFLTDTVPLSIQNLEFLINNISINMSGYFINTYYIERK